MSTGGENGLEGSQWLLAHYNEKLNRWMTTWASKGTCHQEVQCRRLTIAAKLGYSAPVAIMYGYHVQMCINSIALNLAMIQHPSAQQNEAYILLAERAAKAVIDLRDEAGPDGMDFQYAGEVGLG